MADGTATPAAPTTTPTTDTGKVDPKVAWKEFTSKVPLEVTVNKKPQRYDDFDAVRRDLSSAAAYKQKAEELAPRVSQLEGERQVREALKKGADPDKVWEAFESEFGELAMKAAEKRFLSLLQKEKEAEALSPEARKWKQEAEKAAAEKAQYEAQVKQQKQEQERQQFQQQAQQIAEQLNVVLGEALSDSGVTAEAAPYLMPHLAAYIDRADQLGLDVEPKALAQEVFRVQKDMAVGLLSRMSHGAVLELLTGVVLKTPDGKPYGNLARAIMQEHVRRKNGGPAPQGVAPPEPKPQQQQSMGGPMRNLFSGVKREKSDEAMKTLRGFLGLKPPLRRSPV